MLLYHGGKYWNFPKGKLEAEEGSFEAAVRETMEETGLKKSDLRIFDRFKAYENFHFSRGKVKIFKTVIFYLAESKTSEVKISKEHYGFGWFAYKEAAEMLKHYKDSLVVLKKAFNYIRFPKRVVERKKQSP